MSENIRSRKRHGQARIEYRACRKEVEEKLAALGAQVNTGQHPTSSGGRKPRIKAILVEVLRKLRPFKECFPNCRNFEVRTNIYPIYPHNFLSFGNS